MKKIIVLMAAAMFAAISSNAATSDAERINSEGDWPKHLQGVCTDGKSIWWSHTVELSRTDLRGKVLACAKELRWHHGDLCVVSGTVYVAVNHGKFNTEDRADSWVYAYKGDDLSFIKRWKVPELCHGAGGITYHDGHFFVVGGLPPTHDENYVYEYTQDFAFVKRHVLHGWTKLGIQTAHCSGDRFYFGCYGGSNEVTGVTVPSLTLVAPTDLSRMEKVKAGTSVGMLHLNGRMWKAVCRPVDKKAVGKARRDRVSLVSVGPEFERAACQP